MFLFLIYVAILIIFFMFNRSLKVFDIIYFFFEFVKFEIILFNKVDTYIFTIHTENERFFIRIDRHMKNMSK